MVKTIITGMAEGELLEPYDPNLDPEDIKRIHAWARGEDVVPFDTAGTAIPYLEEIAGMERLVKVAGSYRSQCVSCLIANSLIKGITAIGVEDMIIDTDDDGDSLETYVGMSVYLFSLNKVINYNVSHEGNNTIFSPFLK